MKLVPVLSYVVAAINSPAPGMTHAACHIAEKKE